VKARGHTGQALFARAGPPQRPIGRVGRLGLRIVCRRRGKLSWDPPTQGLDVGVGKLATLFRVALPADRRTGASRPPLVAWSTSVSDALGRDRLVRPVSPCHGRVGAWRAAAKCKNGGSCEPPFVEPWLATY
jgi:hypothetical protein